MAPFPDFRTVTDRSAYDVAEVDRFLDRLAEGVGRRPPMITAEEVLAQTFARVGPGQPGYDRDQVDAFLRHAAGELSHRQGRGHAPGASQGGGVPWELSAPAAGSAPPADGPAAYPPWVRLAAIVALVALLGLAIAQVF